MSTEIILNLIWLSLSAILLVALEVSDLRCDRKGTGFCHSKRLIAVFLAAIFIFPCISASDDLWSFQKLRAIPESRRVFQARLWETSENPTWRLAHFFESLQSITLSKPFALSSLFCFFGLVFLPNILTRRRSILPGPGRAPPSITPHA